MLFKRKIKASRKKKQPPSAVEKEKWDKIMKATEMLKHEHEVILKVIEAAQKEVGHIQKTGKIHSEKVAKMLDFIRNFADHCHHLKEEKQLFVRLEEKGMAREGGPIAIMLIEHDEGRRMVRAAADALPPAKKGDRSAIETLRENLSGYAQLLQAHIDKENNILYAMADEILTDEDNSELIEAFEKIENEEIGKGVHEKYHQIAHELAED